MTLKEKLAAVKRYNEAHESSYGGYIREDDYDALLRALDVALRQRNDSLMMCFGESDLNDKYLIEYDAEILAAYEGSTDDKR